jgi:hypothetical protein
VNVFNRLLIVVLDLLLLIAAGAVLLTAVGAVERVLSAKLHELT